MTALAARNAERAFRIFVWSALTVVLILVAAAWVWRLVGDAGAPAVGAAGQQATYEAVAEEYGQIPDFALTERSGRTVTRQDLAGRFWIADFIFTRCNGICPLLTTRMASLARELSQVPRQEELRFVSFSVDPAWDTPEVLAAYARRLGRVDPRWLFLTGDREDLYRLIGEGFRLSVSDHPPEASAGELITHSDRFVLIDPGGRIRGYYHGDDDASMKTLVADLERLRRGFDR